MGEPRWRTETALLQAVADRVEDLLALGGQGADLALPGGRTGGGDLAVEAVEVELEGFELERGGRRVELAGAQDDLWDELGELGGVGEDGRRAGEVASEALGGKPGQRRGEERVEVGLGELGLPQFGEGDAEREERALGLLAAVEGLPGAVDRAAGRRVGAGAAATVDLGEPAPQRGAAADPAR